MKRCPHCSRSEADEAQACFFCGYQFTGKEPRFDPAERARKPMSPGAKIGCVILSLFGVCLLVLAIMFAQCAAGLSHI
jgi:uncharacterized membrane protein YvbJ